MRIERVVGFAEVSIFLFLQSYSFITRKSNKTAEKHLVEHKISQGLYLIVIEDKKEQTPPFVV